MITNSVVWLVVDGPDRLLTVRLRQLSGLFEVVVVVVVEHMATNKWLSQTTREGAATLAHVCTLESRGLFICIIIIDNSSEDNDQN